MEQRVKDAGFVTPAKVEHLVVASDGLTTTATMTK